jgi:hypothetical protein
MLRFASLTALVSLAGCTSLNPPTALTDPASLFRTAPTMMVVNVVDAPLEVDTVTKTQGLLCRAYFFRGDDGPLQVSGETLFKIYDKGKNGEDPRPARMYTTPPHELANHYRKDFIGHSYLFYLPYEPEKKTEIVVIGAFQPTNGKAFTSTPVKQILLPSSLAKAMAHAAKPSPSKLYPQYTIIDRNAGKAPLPNGTTIASGVAGPMSLPAPVSTPVQVAKQPPTGAAPAAQ